MNSLFEKGTGTKADPFIITTPEQLSNVRLTQSGYYKLANNINLNVPPYNTSDGWLPIEGFTGVFDGDGHTISGLYINRPAFALNCGLFGQIITNTTTQIKNLKLTSVNIVGSNAQYIGALIGLLTVSGSPTDYILYNIEINGRIKGMYIGSIIGQLAGTGGYATTYLLSDFIIDTELLAISVTVNTTGSLIGNTTMTTSNLGIQKGFISCKYSGFYNSTSIGGYPITGNADYTDTTLKYVYINSDLWKGTLTTKINYLSTNEFINLRRLPNFNIIPTMLRHNIRLSEPLLKMDVNDPICILADNKTYIFNKATKTWLEVSITDITFIDKNKFYLSDLTSDDWSFFVGKSDVNLIYCEPKFLQSELIKATVTLDKDVDATTDTKMVFNKEIVFDDSTEFVFI